MTLSFLCEISGGCKKILQSNLDYRSETKRDKKPSNAFS